MNADDTHLSYASDNDVDIEVHVNQDLESVNERLIGNKLILINQKRNLWFGLLWL